MQECEGAVSFSGVRPPEDAKEFKRAEHPVLGTVIYYKAPESGTIYYTTRSGLEFAARMEKAIQRQKIKK